LAVDLLKNKFGVSQLYKHDVKQNDEIILTVYWHPLTIAEREIIDSKIATGTFSLLEKSITGKTPEQIDSIVRQYKKVFGPEFSLLDQTMYSFAKSERGKLNNGNVVFRKELPENDNNADELAILYYKSKSSGLVWRVHLDLDMDVSLNQHGIISIFIPNKFGHGIFYLLQSEITQTTNDNRDEKLKTLEAQLGLPISIRKIHYRKNTRTN